MDAHWALSLFFAASCGIARLIAKEQVLKKQEGGPSAANLRHVKKYISEARPFEDGIDEVALRKLVKSSSFKKFVQRLELENEVGICSIPSLPYYVSPELRKYLGSNCDISGFTRRCSSLTAFFFHHR